MVAAWNQSAWMPFAYVIPFLGVLIGVKILIAVTFDRSKQWMSDGGLLWAIRLSSLTLIVLAGVFALQGYSSIS